MSLRFGRKPLQDRFPGPGEQAAQEQGRPLQGRQGQGPGGAVRVDALEAAGRRARLHGAEEGGGELGRDVLEEGYQLVERAVLEHPGGLVDVAADEAVDQGRAVHPHYVFSTRRIDACSLKREAGTETRPSPVSSRTEVAVMSTISPWKSPTRTLWPTR